MARTRREFLRDSGAAALVLALPPSVLPGASGAALSSGERRTLRAAVARIVPAEGPGDWSAADVGADGYILNLLSGPTEVFAGGPTRAEFGEFQQLSRIKQIGWSAEVKRLQGVYRDGLAQLNQGAGGDFAAVPAPAQDAILTVLDDTGSDFFKALYHHTMEGVYSHPVYGGNRDYRAWEAFGYLGDVHGVRFPNIGPPDAAWNVYGGYAPEEMRRPGA
jgi:hypothetical protein